MATIYILSDFGKLTKRNETIVFVQKDETETILFPYKTEQLVVMGKVTITGDAMRMLSKYKIPVLFLSSNGRFNGILNYGESKNVFLRQKQYKIMDDEQQSLEIARSIVVGKIKNQISFMQRIKRKSSLTDYQFNDLERKIARIKITLDEAEKADNIDSLRGYEGLAAKKYFEVFGFNIIPEWAEFKKRSKNPPKSNVNAVLSLLYVMLMQRVKSAIEGEGLDSMVGNLHAVNYGKESLAFDLVEEFRIPFADTVCCSLFNLNVLSEDDFREVVFSQDDDDYPIVKQDEIELTDDLESENEKTESESVKAVLLNDKGIKKVIAAFEEKMHSLILYEPLNERLSCQKIIFEQVKHYKRIINGEETKYKSFYYK